MLFRVSIEGLRFSAPSWCLLMPGICWEIDSGFDTGVVVMESWFMDSVIGSIFEVWLVSRVQLKLP